MCPVISCCDSLTFAPLLYVGSDLVWTIHYVEGNLAARIAIVGRFPQHIIIKYILPRARGCLVHRLNIHEP